MKLNEHDDYVAYPCLSCVLQLQMFHSFFRLVLAVSLWFE